MEFQVAGLGISILYLIGIEVKYRTLFYHLISVYKPELRCSYHAPTF